MFIMIKPLNIYTFSILYVSCNNNIDHTGSMSYRLPKNHNNNKKQNIPFISASEKSYDI